mmetsp:Transcript_117087/g.331735  ORF Transcript_117087/g.331735 Transcript_117087/m.331735 type:complete len:394 (+) Transcript_117087:365-1546(+)
MKPARPVATFLHSSRVMPDAASFSGAPMPSKTSFTSTFPTVLLFAMSKLSVTEMPFTQTYRRLNICWKSAKLMAPSPSASMTLNMARRRSSLNVSSSRCVASGSFSRHATKASTFSPPSSFRHASSDSSFSLMWALITEARVWTLVETRNSSPPCSTSGAASSVAFSASFTAFATISFTSTITFLAVNFCSNSLTIAFVFAKPTAAAFSRTCSFCSVSECPTEPLEAAFRSARNFLASSALASTSLTWAEHFSQRSAVSSSVIAGASSSSFISSSFFFSLASPPSLSSLPSAGGAGGAALAARGAIFSFPFLDNFAKGSDSFSSFWMSSSSLSTFSAASCICAVFLRPSVSLRNCPSFAAAELMRSVSFANSSTVGFDTASAKPFTSRFFDAT